VIVMTIAAEPRIVEATREHVPFIAWVTLEAFRSHLPSGFWDFMFHDMDEAGKLRYLETLVSTGQRHWSHYSTFLVAEVEGRPVSAMCGYFAEDLGESTLQLAGAEANEKTGRTVEQSAAGFERARTIMNVLPAHVAGAWIVENVATLPDFRRRGLSERLMGAILERGRAKGASTADISVFIGNDGAQRAYEKCGFEVVGEKLDAEFETVYGTPGIRTLRRAI
jgi:ribosomal protein S18 acetylase RimI-like enzyme